MSPGSWFRTTALNTRRIILPLRVLGSISTKFSSLITATGAEFAADGLEQLALEVVGRGVVVAQGYECGDYLAAQLVGAAGYARLGYGGMREERGFHLYRADAVGGYLDDFVGAAGEPDIAVFVYVRRVAGEIYPPPRDFAPIVGGVALRLAPEHRRQAWEGALDDEYALFARLAGLAL